MITKFFFFGFNVEVPISHSNLEIDDYSVDNKLEEILEGALNVKWSVEKEENENELESTKGTIEYFLFPERFQFVEAKIIWEEIKRLNSNISTKLKIPKGTYYVEPLTDLGFGYEFEDFLTVEESPDGQEIFGIGYSPTKYSNDWSINSVKVDKAWTLKVKSNPSKKVDGEGIRIGLLDTGYTDHPEIGSEEGHFSPDDAFDTYDKDNDVTDPLKGLFGGGFRPNEPIPLPGHGTATGSLLNSKKNAKTKMTDILGVAPGAEIIPYRTGESQILTSRRLRESVTRAIALAADPTNGNCQILSMSMGYLMGSPKMREAIDEATKKGVIIVAAAGQVIPGLKAPWWFMAKPARYRNTIAVAASNIDNQLCDWAFRGDWIDTMAPGMDVWVASWKGKEKKEDNIITVPGWGSSYATPHVAGIAALWLEMWGDEFKKNNVLKEQKTWLFRYVIDKALNKPERYWNWGLINAKAVLEYDWTKDNWSKGWLQNPTDDEYTWAEELALGMPGSTFMLRSVSFKDYENAALQVLLDRTKIKGRDKEQKMQNFEAFLKKRYHILMFYLFVNRSFLMQILREIGENLNLGVNKIFPSQARKDIEIYVESEAERNSEEIWNDILDF